MEQGRSRNQGFALKLFAVYYVLYSAFVFVNAFWPAAMDIQVSGVNLAVWSGFFLILGALVLSVFYGLLAKEDTDSAAQ